MINLNKHYAGALAAYGGETGRLEQFYTQANGIVNRTAASGEISDELVRFLSLIPEKKRMAVLRRFLKIASEKLGILPTRIISAYPLSPGQIGRITERFEAITGKRLDVTAEVDPRIVGGTQVLAGNKFYDESVKTQMNLMNKNMKEVLIHHAE